MLPADAGNPATNRDTAGVFGRLSKEAAAAVRQASSRSPGNINDRMTL